jgi:hypothetical protein
MARMNEPRITNIPSPTPANVGQDVPDLGREAGVAVGDEIGGEVGAQTQFWLVTQDGFLQKPW